MRQCSRSRSLTCCPDVWTLFLLTPFTYQSSKQKRVHPGLLASIYCPRLSPWLFLACPPNMSKCFSPSRSCSNPASLIKPLRIHHVQKLGPHPTVISLRQLCEQGHHLAWLQTPQGQQLGLVPLNFLQCPHQPGWSGNTPGKPGLHAAVHLPAGAADGFCI